MPVVEAPLVPKQLMNVKQVAGVVGVCQKTIWSSTSPRGDLPCVKVGRRTLYDPAHVSEWVAAHVVRPPAPKAITTTETP